MRLPLLAVLAAGLLSGALLGAAPAGAAAKPKAPKANASLARQIAALERSTNTLSGEVSALTAEAANLEARVQAPPATPLAGAPTPAPETPAAGPSFGGTFPNPTLLPGSVGSEQLGEGSVTADKVVDGSIRSDDIALGTITASELGVLSPSDFAAAVAGNTLGRRLYGFGPSQLFELGVPREQTVTLSVHCAGRIIGGGWKLVPGELGAEIMASVPAFISGSQSTEHDWTVTVHEQFTNTTIRNRMDTSGLCIQ